MERWGESSVTGPSQIFSIRPEEWIMNAAFEIKPVVTRRELRQFVKFPWRVYAGDSNWVPPLIAERMGYLDPARGPFYQHAEVVLYLALQGGEVVGTIASFVDHSLVESLGQREGGFGFFEVIEDYTVAERLLDAMQDWLRSRQATLLRGPTNFSDTDSPGVLVGGEDCPPVMLEAHTPPYYKDYLEQYGMQKDYDLYAWRAYRSQIGRELENLPPELNRVAEVAQRAANVSIRKIDLQHWDEEIDTAYHLYTTTLYNLSERSPITKTEFRRLAEQMRPFLNPNLALYAEVDGEPVGFIIAIPDINQVLIHLNGRLFPFGWLKLKRYIGEIDVVTFKMMGVLEKYRRRGIDALLYLKAVRAFYEAGYAWLDGSVTSERNTTINLVAQRLGAQRYKHYRLYKMGLDGG
jgi:GNAT superfamily N-acetyltransferase